MAKKSFVLFALLASLATSACIDLDVKGEIKDLRILAVKLDPPEILYSPFLIMPASERLFESPPVNVTATVLAADPSNDQPIEFLTSICPLNSNEDCRNYQLPKEFENERQPELLRSMLEPLVALRSVDLTPVGEYGTIDATLSTFHFPERVVEYILPHDESGAAFVLFQSYARVMLEAESKGVREVAFRRIPMNVNFDFSMFPPEVRQEVADQFSQFLGFAICTPEQELQQAPDCLKSRSVNQNPVIEEVRYSLDGERPEYTDDGVDKRNKGDLVTGPIEVEPGQRISVWPVFNNDVREAYQVFEVDIQTTRFSLGNFKEDIAVSWYSTAGVAETDLSELTINQGFDTGYTYPDNKPPEMVQLYMIARDQRGGITWATVELKKK